MPEAEIVAQLAATTLCAGIDPAGLRALAAVFHPAQFGPGRVIAGDGRIDVTLWVVVEGSVALQRRRADGGTDRLGFRRFGDVIGIRGVFTATPRTHAAVTAEPTTLLYADGRALWSVLRAHDRLLGQLDLPDPVRQHLRMPTEGGAIHDERTAHVVRRHWIAFVPRLLVLPPLVFMLFAGLSLGVSLFSPSERAMGVLAGIGVGATILVAVWLFFDYWNDELSITNRRIIHSESTPLINVRQSAARLERIQDVRIVQPTLMAKLFGYGDIFLHTAGTRGTLRFTMIPRPEAVRAMIFAQAKAAREMADRERQEVITRKVLAATGVGSDEIDDGPVTATRAPGREVKGTVERVVDALSLWTSREDVNGVITWRKHWWFLIKATLLPLTFLALATMLIYWLWAYGAGDAAGGADAGGAAVDLASSAWRWLAPIWLLILGWVVWQYADWRNDFYVLTDEHVIDVEQLPLGLFSERRQASLGQIQDVRFVVPNPLARLLNYGTVLIQTASETGAFSFEFVHRPASVQEKIFMRMDEREQRIQREEQRRRDDEMLRWLTTYHEIAEAPADAGTGGGTGV